VARKRGGGDGGDGQSSCKKQVRHCARKNDYRLAATSIYDYNGDNSKEKT